MNDLDNMNNNEKISSALKALHILDCFALESPEWTISELSKRTGHAVSSLHRQLNDLVAYGYLEQVEKRKTYRIGKRLIWLSYSVIGKYDLRNVSLPLITELATAVEENTHLILMDGYDVFNLEIVEANHSISYRPPVVSRYPAHMTAAGKVLLTGKSENFIEQYCSNIVDVPPLTSNSITDPQVLKYSLKQIHEDGFAIDNEETEIGLICIAMPVYDLNHEICAAVSISGPVFRLKDRVVSFIPLLRDCVSKISKTLGY